jgi:hypothetical protein
MLIVWRHRYKRTRCIEWDRATIGERDLVDNPFDQTGRQCRGGEIAAILFPPRPDQTYCWSQKIEQ